MKGVAIIFLFGVVLVSQHLAWAQDASEADSLDTQSKDDAIIFNKRDSNNLKDLRGLVISGVISTLVGTSLLAYYIANVYPSDLEKDWRELFSFAPFQQYDFLLFSSIFLSSIGASAMYIGTSYDLMNGTEKDFKRWKKLHLITGITSLTLGGILLGTGYGLYTLYLQNPDSFGTYLPVPLTAVSGAGMITIGLPSFIIGIF